MRRRTFPGYSYMYHSSWCKSFRIFGKMRPAQEIEVDFLINGEIGYRATYVTFKIDFHCIAIFVNLTLPKIKSHNLNITGQWISQFKNRTTVHYVGNNSAFSLFPKSAKLSMLAYLSYPWILNPRHRGNNFTILVEGFM